MQHLDIKRTFTTGQRSDAIRERVRDAVTMLGHGDFGYGIVQFSKRCTSVAELHGMRIWKSKAGEEEWRLGMNSVRNLLGLRTSATLRCEHWVLDLFQAAIDDIYRGQPVPRTPPDPARAQLDEIHPTGVRPFQADVPLADQLLDAYLDKDDERMITLCLEVGKIERRSKS